MKNRTRLFATAFALLVLVTLLLVPRLAAQRIKQPLPPALDNIHEVSRVEVRDAAGQVVLVGTFSTKSDTDKELEREARLTSPGGDARAKGLAEIEIEKGGAPAEKELEVKVERLSASTRYTLFVDDKEIMTFSTNGRGNADIKLSTSIRK